MDITTDDFDIINENDITDNEPKQISLWDCVKNFFNNNANKYVTRRELMKYIRNNGHTIFSSSTIDTYRNYLCKAGYLSTIIRGNYRLQKKIPANLTLTDVKIQAYKIKDFKPIVKKIVTRYRKINKNDIWSTHFHPDIYEKIRNKKRDYEFLSEDDFML